MNTEWIISYLEKRNLVHNVNKDALQRSLQLVPEIFL
jgi:hypothetical protein